MDEFSDSGFNGNRSFEKTEDKMVWKRVGVLSICREAMVGGVERDFNQAHIRIRRELRTDFLDIERSVDEGYGATQFLYKSKS